MAYALVVSLKRTLEPLVDSSGSRIQLPNSELKLFYDSLCYLKSFFDKIKSLEDSNSVEEVEKEIKLVLENTQDLIESHLSDLVRSGDESSISDFSRKLVKVKDTLGALIKKLNALYLTGDQQQQSPDPSAADAVAVSSEDTDFVRNEGIVGLRDEVTILLRWLHRRESSLQVISIVGMGGIGKTTLAKEVYWDPNVMYDFAVRLSVRVDFKYEIEQVLRRLLVGLVVTQEIQGRSFPELGDLLRKHLYGRRYLIVLDAIWDTRAWDQLQHYFPDDENGSVIIMTTRIADVVRGVCDEESILQKRFLNDDESWDLLSKLAFPDTEFKSPLALEEIGKEIAKNLGGLPLAMLEIGKHLSNSPATLENWKAVSQNVNSLIQETTILEILNPSYVQLPPHLKACFLYMGVFQPNYSIPTSLLIRLWVAEKFIEPVADNQSLEKRGEEYLANLVSRGLVIAGELSSSSGRMKTCRIHQFFYNLCISAAREERLFHIVNEGTTNSTQGTKKQRRLGVHNNALLGFKQVQSLMKLASSARSLLCVGTQEQHQHPLQLYLGFNLLRVLHALAIRFGKFPDQVPKLLQLRYLAITCDGEVPPSISRLWNLEVLIIHRSQGIKSSVLLPFEIWELHKLRHIECMGFDLPDPCAADAAAAMDDVPFLNKLLTLSGVSAKSCTDRVLARMPNLIKLGVWFEPTHYAVGNFSEDNAIFIRLHHLESFKCVVMNPGLESQAVSSSLTVFPSALTKLTLSGCEFPWELMLSIAALPNLQALKLRWRAFSGPEWVLGEEDFRSLKFLLLEDLDIEMLIAESYDLFPRLEYLLLRRCYKLQEIPSEMGDIPTLRVIEVNDCSMYVTESVRLIEEEQQEFGNEGLRFLIHSS